MHYLSWLTGNAGLAVNVFEGLKDLYSSQIGVHLFNFLQNFLHSLLTVCHTLTAITKHTHGGGQVTHGCGGVMVINFQNASFNSGSETYSLLFF